MAGHQAQLTVDAAVLYQAYRMAMDGRGFDVPSFDNSQARGAPWFTLANGLPALLIAGVRSPVDVDLLEPIVPLVGAEDGTVVLEDLPTRVTVRPYRAADLVSLDGVEGTETRECAITAFVVGLDRQMFEFRLALADAEALTQTARALTGGDLVGQAMQLFEDAGGELLDDDDEKTTAAAAVAWDAVVFAALAKNNDTHIVVRTRDADLPEIKVGPLRVAHVNAYEDNDGEFAGRFAALALATGVSIDRLGLLRIEDFQRLWSAFCWLKKKSQMAGRSRASAALSTRSTTGVEMTSPS